VRVSADLTGLWVIAVYLGSPGLFARAGLGGVSGVSRAGGVAGLVGRSEAMTEMEEA